MGVPEDVIPTFTQKLGSAVGQGGNVNPEAWSLLVPNGKPPFPAYLPQKARSPDNLWVGHSLRLDREVFCYADLEYDHWYLVESNPQVIWFCEQYPQIKVRIGSSIVEVRYDMLLCYADNCLELREIKPYDDFREPQASYIKKAINRSAVFC